MIFLLCSENKISENDDREQVNGSNSQTGEKLIAETDMSRAGSQSRDAVFYAAIHYTCSKRAIIEMTFFCKKKISFR